MGSQRHPKQAAQAGRRHNGGEAGADERRAVEGKEDGKGLTSLTIHFTETFQGECVVLDLDDLPSIAADNLQTDPRTGLARTVTLPIKPGAVSLRASLKGGAGATAAVDAATLKFLTVELRPEGLLLTPVTKADYAAQPRGFA